MSAVSHMMLIPRVSGYRYFRWYVTKIIGASLYTNLMNAQLSTNGGSSYLWFDQTSATAPSPRVVSAISENGAGAGFEGWRAFDNSLTSSWTNTTLSDGSGNFSTPQWVQMDVGAGNEITPNSMRMAFYNTGGADATWVNFSLKASNTGSFSGEEATLKTVSGQGSQAHATNVTYTIP